MYVKVKRLSNLRELPLPQYAKKDDSGRDLMAAIDEDIILEPGEIAKVPTGIALDLGPGMEAIVRPRSGLSLKKVLVYLGTIDRGFRSEICVIIQNLSFTDHFTISRGNRIAQLIVNSIDHYEWEEVEELTETERGNSGFGSSGI